MAASRMLKMSGPLRCFSPSNESSPGADSQQFEGKTSVNCAKSTSAARIRPSVMSWKSMGTSMPSTSTREVHLPSLVITLVPSFIRESLRPRIGPIPSKLQVQLLVERAILDCRFFTLLAVAGSLAGSILCFVEGVFTVLESYLQWLHAMSRKMDQAHVVHLLIEAIDLFLIGTAVLMFGMGIYAMFVGVRSSVEGGGRVLSGSNFFGLFALRTLPTWVEIDSVSQAKSRFGHALTLLLQVGVLEKFKSTPLVTGLDLACFAGAVLLSSACVFLLSKLSNPVNHSDPSKVTDLTHV